jgi:hypothetical protein
MDRRKTRLRWMQAGSPQRITADTASLLASNRAVLLQRLPVGLPRKRPRAVSLSEVVALRRCAASAASREPSTR